MPKASADNKRNGKSKTNAAAPYKVSSKKDGKPVKNKTYRDATTTEQPETAGPSMLVNAETLIEWGEVRNMIFEIKFDQKSFPNSSPPPVANSLVDKREKKRKSKKKTQETPSTSADEEPVVRKPKKETVCLIFVTAGEKEKFGKGWHAKVSAVMPKNIKPLAFTIADDGDLPDAKDIGLANSKQVLKYMILDLGMMSKNTSTGDATAQLTVLGQRIDKFTVFIKGMVEQFPDLKVCQIIIQSDWEYLPKMILSRVEENLKIKFPLFHTNIETKIEPQKCKNDTPSTFALFGTAVDPKNHCNELLIHYNHKFADASSKSAEQQRNEFTLAKYKRAGKALRSDLARPGKRL